MNGAECGKCGHIQCQCKRIARERKETKDKLIEQLQAENKRLKELLAAVESVYPGRFSIKQALRDNHG